MSQGIASNVTANFATLCNEAKKTGRAVAVRNNYSRSVLAARGMMLARKKFALQMVELIENCKNRDNLLSLFNSYQKAKQTNGEFGRFTRTGRTGLLPWTRFQDHYMDEKGVAHTYATSKTDSLIIKAMKKKRDILERSEITKLTVDDSKLKSFNRKAWYTSNTFLIASPLALAAGGALVYFTGGLAVPVVAGIIAAKAVIAAAAIAGASIVLNICKGIAHFAGFRAANKPTSAAAASAPSSNAGRSASLTAGTSSRSRASSRSSDSGVAADRSASSSSASTVASPLAPAASPDDRSQAHTALAFSYHSSSGGGASVASRRSFFDDGASSTCMVDY